MAGPIRRGGGAGNPRQAASEAGARAARQTLEQQRSAYAWQQVNEAPCTSDFVNLVKGLPAMMMGNGLLQTLAFLVDKDKDHHRAAAGLVFGWLAERGFVEPSPPFEQLRKLTQLSSGRYMQATEEALAILRWARQFAAARKSAKS